MKTLFKYGFLFSLLLLIPAFSYAQLSPGDLSEPHTDLEGLKNCTKCHVLGEKETTSKCLECHTEIQQLINQNRGYHSSTEAKGKKCASCHGEHFGLHFEITRFEANSFNHDLTSYTLEGRHSELSCNDCHNRDLIQTGISKKQGNTYLGLGMECLSCHEDYHQDEQFNNCLSCHSQVAFLPASGFDHANTRFPLLGKHQSLDCAACHTEQTNERDQFKQFAAADVNNCTLCHEDIHNNEFGSDCTKCHTVNTFQRTRAVTAFNHENTSFPLRGMHRNVGCRDCHAGSYNLPVEHQSCSDCHADFHENQFAVENIAPDCATCHTVQGFSPSTYTIEAHNQTSFPLEGAHMATPCVVCHQSEGEWNFRMEASSCTSCHENVHQNVLAERFVSENNCVRCHALTTWDDVTFKHNLTNFELEGKHNKVECRACHFFELENGSTRQQFTGLSVACENCHDDIHFDQFRENNVNDCERCHSSENWLAEKFNHNESRFKLDGEHLDLDCVQCHKPTDGLIQNYIIYKIEDVTCASCH